MTSKPFMARRLQSVVTQSDEPFTIIADLIDLSDGMESLLCLGKLDDGLGTIIFLFPDRSCAIITIGQDPNIEGNALCHFGAFEHLGIMLRFLDAKDEDPAGAQLFDAIPSDLREKVLETVRAAMLRSAPEEVCGHA